MSIELKPGFFSGEIPSEGISWRDAAEECFQIYGLYSPLIYDRGEEPARYQRLPDEVAAEIGGAIQERLYKHTAGGRVRFRTNSRYVAIRAYWDVLTESPHIPSSGTSGFDLYLTEDGNCRYYKSFIPPYKPDDRRKGYTSANYFPDRKMREITIHMPLYNQVTRLEIGLESDAVIEHAPYGSEKPIVYYGSSITQGACASRPGNTYQAYIARRFDMDYRNIGFSDGARGELCIANYIASIDMAAFVYDYDHNAADAQWLWNTHYNFYEVIRKAHPEIPIICVSRPDPRPCDRFSMDEAVEKNQQRKEAILGTVKKARENGDQNIYFVDGEALYGEDASDCCSVDGTHPTDLGFYRMACGIGDALEQAFKNVKEV